MSKFPEYLEEWLNVVELNIHLYQGPISTKVTMEGLRERIDRYAREAIAAAMIDREIDAPRLARLEKAVQDVIGQSCEDWCESSMGQGADCTCHIGRLKAALEGGT